MFGRTSSLIVLLMLAVAVPIGLSKATDLSLPNLRQTWSKWMGKATSDGNTADSSVETTDEKGKKIESDRIGQGPSDLAKVFRFDISPAWVLAQWSRVSSSLRDGKLQGLRVAYVSGTSRADIAGALTYYFDSKQQLQRIYFEGYTGDANPLIQLVAKNYRLRAASAKGAGVFISGWNGSPTSMMRIRYAPVVEHSQPHTRQEIVVELNRPGVGYGLSQRSKSILAAK